MPARCCRSCERKAQRQRWAEHLRAVFDLAIEGGNKDSAWLAVAEAAQEMER
jgi:hypothetical protein